MGEGDSERAGDAGGMRPPPDASAAAVAAAERRAHTSSTDGTLMVVASRDSSRAILSGKWSAQKGEDDACQRAQNKKQCNAAFNALENMLRATTMRDMSCALVVQRGR